MTETPTTEQALTLASQALSLAAALNSLDGAFASGSPGSPWYHAASAAHSILTTAGFAGEAVERALEKVHECGDYAPGDLRRYLTVTIAADADPDLDENGERTVSVWDDGLLWDEDEVEVDPSTAASVVEERAAAYREQGVFVAFALCSEVARYVNV